MSWVRRPARTRVGSNPGVAGEATYVARVRIVAMVRARLPVTSLPAAVARAVDAEDQIRAGDGLLTFICVVKAPWRCETAAVRI